MSASPNFDERPPSTPIDMLVIHYTGMATADAALDRLCDPKAKVSAHYVIDEDGLVAPLVGEHSRAWHAGAAFWRGETDINARSIGIELVNPGHEFGYRDFPQAQMAALVLGGVSIEVAAEMATCSAAFFMGSNARVTASTPEKQFRAWRKHSNIAIQLKSWFDGLSEQKQAEFRSQTLAKVKKYNAGKFLPKHLKGNRRGDRKIHP